jgi:hypothetical protein
MYVVNFFLNDNNFFIFMKLYMRIHSDNGILEIVLEQFGREIYFIK